MFEPTKEDNVPFDGVKIKVGGNFTVDFQTLRHENDATPVLVDSININQLMPLTNGFNLPMANFTVDAQLADGIRMNLTLYLSSRHHRETWVKGGYIQMDKLPFIKSRLLDNVMKATTIKVGAYDVNYGDAHYRRTDGGNSIHNPFVENYILDQFTTEIGGEIMWHPRKLGIIAMVGMTNGQLNPTVIKPSVIDSATGKVNKLRPAFVAKLGYDKQWNDFRVRLTGSVYRLKSTSNATLYFGDRTGSHYFYAMENNRSTADANVMINPFIKFKGLELFGTYEIANGRTIRETDTRQITQMAVDVVYRFPKSEIFWIAGRYNMVKGALDLTTPDATISRGVGSVGWFVTKNIMAKVEYVYQRYSNFADTDIRSGGKFSGVMVQGSIAF